MRFFKGVSNALSMGAVTTLGLLGRLVSADTDGQDASDPVNQSFFYGGLMLMSCVAFCCIVKACKTLAQDTRPADDEESIRMHTFVQMREADERAGLAP